MDYYLIDLENVRKQGLMGADLLGTNDTIVIFYSHAANTIRAIDRDRIEQGGARVQIRSVNVHTKNALDFELSIYVGILISSVFLWTGKRAEGLSADKGSVIIRRKLFVHERIR